MRTALASLSIVLAILAALYLGLVALLYFRQESMLFFPVRTDPRLAREWRERRVEIPAGPISIEGWWAENPPGAGRATVLYFGGNAEDVLGTAEAAPLLHARRLLVTSYRGYGGTPGTPGQEALYADALAVYDYAVRHAGAAPGEIVLAGRSLGSGVATYLAAHRPVGGVVLITPFDRLASVAARHYPYFPVRALMRNPFPTDDFARRVTAPALLLAGTRDDVIPAEHAERLARAWAGPKEIHLLEGAGHNDIQEHPEYYARINRFLAGLR